VDLERVLQFLHDCQVRGEPCVLVTVCAVEGSSMRNAGTIMGVAQDGSFAGSLSGGCIENAVVAEALDTLKTGASRLVRFGAGSRYFDIKLPCGGGIDLHFCPLVEPGITEPALKAIAARQPISITIERGAAQFVSGWQTMRFDPETQTGTFGHWPVPRVTIIGHGAGVEALARLGQTMGCAVEALTPDESIVADLTQLGIASAQLERRSQTDLLKSDPWTAIVFLFHDHDWETELLQRALALPHFYLGAMGGRKAHANRCEALRTRGVTDAQLETIRAPIGLFHSSRDPQTLALSTLAEVIRAYGETDFEAEIG